jgi:O-antigen ligase
MSGAGLLGILLALTVFAGLSIPLIGNLGSSDTLAILGRDSTFTGRTVLWNAILPVAFQHSLLGVGYGSFWINPPISYSLSVMVNESHNGYLDVFVELGLLGLFLFLCFLFSFFRAARVALVSDFEPAAFALCLLLIILVHNILESSFLRPTNHMGAILFFLSILISRLNSATAQTYPDPDSIEDEPSEQPILF